MALIQTVSLGSISKYFTRVSGIILITCFLFPNLVYAQEDAGVYRVKRSGEETPEAPVLPPPSSSKPGGEGLPIPPAQIEPPQVYVWEHSPPKTIKRHERLVEPDQYLDHSLLGKVLKKYVSKQGWVNYRGLGRDKRAKATLEAYVEDLSQMDPSTLSDPMDRLSAWLNLYNSLVLLEILNNYPIQNLMQIPDFFGNPRFKIGDQKMSLIQIEQEVFRDQLREPRAILARVNGATSGPRFLQEPFKATKLDEQLDDRTWKFLMDKKNVEYDPRTRTLNLNPTFLWYQEEFGDLLMFLRAYLDLLPQNFIVAYRGYDWKLNDEKLH